MPPKHSRHFNRRARAISQSLGHFGSCAASTTKRSFGGLPTCLVGIVIDYSADWATAQLIAKLTRGDARVCRNWEASLCLTGNARARQVTITIVDRSLQWMHIAELTGINVTTVARALEAGHSAVVVMLTRMLPGHHVMRIKYSEGWIKEEVGRLAAGLITWAGLGQVEI